jgi:ubiquinone/menaquinone biosynthesis C-methylase UbiE
MPEDYFIGVHGRELERLKDQHEAWRPETETLWAAAGFGAGQHLADLGSGPGFTALDLAQRVGTSGSIMAIDKASPYLDFLSAEAGVRGLFNIRTVEADITRIQTLEGPLHGTFCRFFLAFLIGDLDRVLALIHRSLEAGGTFAAMEYLTLGSTTCSPPLRGFDAHTQAWARYYARHGGDTAVGSYLPAKLTAAGFDITHMACVGGMAGPSHRWWRWWGRLIEDFGDTLAAEGFMSTEELEQLRHDWTEASSRSGAFIYTPVLVQLVARKR